jgi:hypothetical protein
MKKLYLCVPRKEVVKLNASSKKCLLVLKESRNEFVIKKIFFGHICFGLKSFAEFYFLRAKITFKMMNTFKLCFFEWSLPKYLIAIVFQKVLKHYSNKS